MHQMVLLGDISRVEARFSTYGDNVCLGTREVHGWHRTLHRLGSSFRCNRWYSSVKLIMWKHVSVRVETMFAQDKCKVGTVRCIGLEVDLNAPDGTPRGRWSSGSTFRYVWRQC